MALADAVEREHVALGHTVWPTPRVRDMAGWLRDEYQRRQLLDASLPRLLTDVEERELWRRVVQTSHRAQEFLEIGGAARGAMRARRAMSEHGIPLEALVPFGCEETSALLEWTRAFETRCRDLGCIGADRLLALAPPHPLGLAWIDTPQWRPEARRWLVRHGGQMLEPDACPDPAEPVLCHAGSPAEELAACADWCRERLLADPGFRAWVCIPDLATRREEAADAFDAALAPWRYSTAATDPAAAYALAGGSPLDRCSSVRAALLCLSASQGMLSFEAFSELLRLPELQATPGEAAAAACLDLALRRHAPSEANLADWLDLSQTHAAGQSRAVPALARLQALFRLLSAERGERSMSRWVAVWVPAFEAAPWALRARWSSGEFQAAERCRELLAALALGDAVFGRLSAAAAIGLLLRTARETSFQPQTGIPPIWVTAQAIDPWLNYSGLWVAGCGEERWPPPPDPLPLLPVGLQRQHGIAAAAADLQLLAAADLQNRWHRRAETGIFSHADAGEGRRSSPSPLLSDARRERVGARTRPHWRALAAAGSRLETLRDELAPPFVSQEKLRGVATLRAQSRCPFRGFAETRLSIEVLERPVPGFNQRERGEMLHHALEHVWGVLKSSARLAAIDAGDLRALVHAAVRDALARQCRRRDPGEPWRRREAVRQQRIIDQWLDCERKRAPFEVETLEGAGHDARLGGLTFTVRIDRIDRLLDGGRVLIDYKSGAAGVDWRGERPDNPQLPIYAQVRPDDLVAVAYARVSAEDMGFVAEAARAGIFKPQGRATTLEGLPDFGALVVRWSQRVERIAAGFAAGDAAIAPTAHACQSCRLHALCRIANGLDDETVANE